MRGVLPVSLILLLAGCIGAPLDAAQVAPQDAEVAATLAALVADLPCEASGVPAAGTSDNLLDVATLGYDDTMHGELDARDGWMLVARYEGGGFEVVDVRDPTAPRHVAVYQSEEESALDVKWLPDGRSAVVGHFGTIGLVDVGPVLDGTGEPRLVTEWVHPSKALPPHAMVTNMHMLYTASIAEKDYVFLAPNDDTGVWILEVVGEGDARTIEYVTNAAFPLGGGFLGPHDMWVGIDETTQQPWLYVSNGFEGWAAYDVSDPAKPKLLAVMPNLDPGQGYTHSIMAQKIGDRRIVATIAEVGVNMLKIWDATRIEAPILLAEWVADKTKPTSMQHNLQIVDGLLYVAHYGNGVYVFDLTKLGPTVPLAGTATLAPIAHYQPAEANVWDVALADGLVYVNDIIAGTHVVAFGCIQPGDKLQTSTG